jgi:hypothetical protein
MPVADPVPIAAQPYITRGRCDADNLHARRRRRHHHHTAGIVTLIGNYYASRQARAEH